MKIEEEMRSRPKSLMFSRLADSYRKSGNVQQAISICLEGLATHPDYITGRILLGRCYLEQEKFNDAIKEFTRVCKIDRRNQITIKMLADIFSKQGMETKAGDLYHLLLKMDPENASLIHLSTVFKGSNNESLFEILGVEEEVRQVTVARPAVKKVPEKTEIEEAQELLGSAGAAPVPEQAVLSEAGDGTDISLQEAAEIIDGSSLEEILSPESGIDDAQGLAAGSQPEPETLMELVAEPETIPAVESVADKAPQQVQSASPVSPEPPRHADISLDEDELPEGTDITARMSSMFGDETGDKGEATIEIMVPEVEVAAGADEEEPVASQGKAPAGEPSQEPVDEAVSAISSRMEEMFGAGEISEVSAPTEMLELEPVEEILSESDDETAATVVIDKAELERIGGLEQEPDEPVEEVIASAELSGLDGLEMAEDATDVFAPVAEEEPAKGAPTEIMDLEAKKTEIIEVPLEIENVMESVDLEDPERAASDFQKPDTLMDSMLTEATSVFDRETIRKLTEKESGTKDVAVPLKAGKTAGDESVSGEDVMSRLDEMFPSDVKKGVAPKPKPQAEPDTKDAGGEDGIPAEHRVDGEDVVSRIDEMFADADAIPDEELNSDGKVTDFYTETGDLALLKDTDAILEEVKQITETDNDILTDESSDAVTPLVDETDKEGVMSLDMIPDDALETVQTAGDFNDASGDTLIEEAAAIIDELPEETEKADDDDLLSGEDIVETIDKMFADDGFENKSLLEAIPEDDAIEEKGADGGFYNVAGEQTKGETPAEGVAADRQEEAPLESVPVEDETYFYESEPVKKEQPEQHPVDEESCDPVKAESIPDHVLTPTLADIYFQQDQPYLAVQIYKRLLERDPDNEKIAQRIADIEQAIREREAMLEAADTGKQGEAADTNRKSRAKLSKTGARPLKGIKIKKSIKKRIKKTRL